MSQSNLAPLLAPGRIGALELRNRTVVTAMGVSFAEEDGACGERLIAYHEEQARGGVGLIIMGATGVAWPVGAIKRNQIAISDDRFIPGLKRLADTVHRHGARIAAQLNHGGLNAGFAAAAFGHPLWAPSPPKPPTGAGDFLGAFLPEEMDRSAMSAPAVRVMDEADIATVVRQFAEAAVRAREAGLDGVEIHGGHGYILSSFLSPSTNRRTDQYGGPLENRARLMVEVVRAVRAAVGRDFAVWGKLDWREVGKPDGITLEDAKATARLLEAAGVDAITVSAYHDVAFGKNHTESYLPHTPEANIPAATAIKGAVGVPVIASGRITPQSASAKIAAGQFDFLAMGRLLLADPGLPGKLAAGRAEAVRPCINCYTCVSCIYVGVPMRCAVNPETGLEYLRRDERPAARRRFVVVGGGPAGMEAALRLDAAGQDVVLIEKAERLGGTLQFAALGYQPNEGLLDWLRARIARSEVDVRLRTAADVALVAGLEPDEVFVATGAVRETPPIPGADLPHVFSGDDLRALMLGETSEAVQRKTGLGARIAAKVGAVSGLTANLDLVRQATRRWMPLGQRIVIIGGELVGLELAEFLIERGRRVTVIEESANFGRGLTMVRRARLIPELAEHGAVLQAGASDLRILDEGVAFVDQEGRAHMAGADHVIVAKGARGDSALADSLREAGFRVREFGDGAGVGYIEGAIRGAAEAVTASLG